MTEFKQVPSPFCGIGTDDLNIEVDGLSIKVTGNGCPVNSPAFERAITETAPRIDGKAVKLEVAVKRAAEILRKTNQPVFGGCATDVNGMRALLSLADRSGAVVDNINFNAARRNILALQHSGWMNTTLAEVKNRCDVLLAIGTDIESFSPRFFERYLWNKESMFLDDTGNREIIYLGKAPSGSAAVSPDGRQPTVYECEERDLPDILAVLRALILGNPINVFSIGGIAIAELKAIVDKLYDAKYAVVTWAAGSLNYNQAELSIEMICSIIKDMNKKTRCSGLPLGGREGDQTANQVSGWITGYPSRISYSRSFPEYDPYLYDVNQMLEKDEADALVWVQAFNADAVPPKTDVPTIVVARSGMTFEKEPDIFIPIGTPGIDHAGHAYRMDNVVAIRLKKLRESGLPSTADVLSAIEQAL